MRPGQTAPEFCDENFAKQKLEDGFNEAGADCPGIRRFFWRAMPESSRFNEAGADCPGILPLLQRFVCRKRGSLQ